MLPLFALTLSLLLSKPTLLVPKLLHAAVGSNVRMAEQPSASLASLSPALLQSKRPMGRNQISKEAVGWVQREMRWLAQDYILRVEEETLGVHFIEEQASLLESLEPFSVFGLQAHLRNRLQADPPRHSARALAGAELAARHVPTIWAAFQASVRDRLQQRANGGQVTLDDDEAVDHSSWREYLEWTLLPQIRAHYEAAAASAPPPKRAKVTRAATDTGRQRQQRPRAKGGSKSGSKAAVADARRARSESESAASGPMTKRAPQPNNKQPLGRKEVGVSTLRWMATATERCAVEYISLVDQLSDASTYVGDLESNDGVLRALAPRFGVVPLVTRVDEYLTVGGPPPEDAAEFADMVRTHVPTVWSSFSGAVRTLVQARYANVEALTGAVGAIKWSESPEWLLLRGLYEAAKNDEDFRWKLTRAQKRETLQEGANEPTVLLVNASGAVTAGGSPRQQRDTKVQRAAEESVVAATPPADKADRTAAEGGLSDDSSSAPVPRWMRLTSQGSLELLVTPVWAEGDDAAAVGVDVTDGLQAPFRPLSALQPLEGSSEITARVLEYTSGFSKLLLLERIAALGASAKLIEQLEADVEEAAAAAEAANVRAAEALTAAAAVAAQDVNEDGFDDGAMSAMGEAAAAAREAALALTLSETGPDALTATVRTEPRAVKSLRGVRMRNAQAVDGAAGTRCIVTIFPAGGEGSRLPKSDICAGDVVLIRPPADVVTVAGLLASPSVDGADAAGAAQESLKGVVTKASNVALTIRLDTFATKEAVARSSPLERTNESPRRRDADEMLADLRSFVEEEEKQEVGRLEARARAWLGGEVRVDWLGSDATHARNIAALDALVQTAKHARAGKASAHYAIVRALFDADAAAGRVHDDEDDMCDTDDDPCNALASLTEAPDNAFDTRLDDSQRAAAALAFADRRPLSVIQGPPGSGKTGVVVELVRRAVASGMRVLVCAPSNMAIDGLALRLAAADRSLRLVRSGNPERVEASAMNITAEAVAARRMETLDSEAADELKRMLEDVRSDERMGRERKSQMRDYLRRESRRSVAKRKARGAAEAMADAQVLLCTTTAAGEAAVADLPPFDLVIVDEAAQAAAPNAWLPLLRGRRAVLVGDPKQLPPTIISRDALDGGLGTPLMETAMSAVPGAYTRLSTQYRMHAAIASWSSVQFYDGELASDGSVAKRTLSGLDGVAPNELTTAPLLGVRVEPTPEERASASGGCEARSAGGAIINRAEAHAVVAHVRALLNAGVAASSIAVASPYSAQVDLLRTELAAAAAGGGGGGASTLNEVEVATVDALQGREADAVVISLVRSNGRGSVGFLADERRLNVAVTRARRHLALVCDPTTVGREPILRSLLDHCSAAGSWLPAPPEALAGVVTPTKAASGAPDNAPVSER